MEEPGVDLSLDAFADDLVLKDGGIADDDDGQADEESWLDT